MGQGRHIQSVLLGIALIAVQGFTPDARDLSSPRAISLLSCILPGAPSVPDDDDPSDDVCDPVHLHSSRALCAKALRPLLDTTADDRIRARAPACACPLHARIDSIAAERSSLIDALCRRLC
jgi:hypothetical protein